MLVSQEETMSVSFKEFIVPEDSLKAVTVTVVPPLGGTITLLIPEIVDEVATVTLGPWAEGRYIVDTVVESVLGRRAIINRIVDVVPYSGFITTIGMKAGEQQAFRVSYADRLNDGDTVEEVTAVPPNGVVFAPLEIPDGWIVVIGTSESLDEGGYDVTVTTTTASGRVFTDTVRIIIGDFDA